MIIVQHGEDVKRFFSGDADAPAQGGCILRVPENKGRGERTDMLSAQLISGITID